MNNILHRGLLIVIALISYVTVSAQQLAVESFTRDDSDQAARITSPRRDQNNKLCAIVKMETLLLLQDFTFDAGMTGIVDSEQKTGEIWIYLSPGTRRISIHHKYIKAVRNYEFGEVLKEATVYILKLKSGAVRTVVEENITLQYLEVLCAVEGATIKIDDEAPEPFTNGKFHKAFLYGKHRYMVDAPMYHPESGITEITAEKTTSFTVNLKPKSGKLVIDTQPEQGADVFIDDEKRGQSPLTLDKMPSGEHAVRVVKTLYLPADEKTTVDDGQTTTVNIAMKPNFAVITLTTPDGGDIYVNDEKRGTAQWSGRLTPGQYKVEVRKLSHRSSVTTVVSEAGKDKTVSLEAPSPIYGSLEVKETNVKANIFIDGEKRGTTPVILNRILVGSHTIELQAEGYKLHRQSIEVQEGKILPVSVKLQEEEKISLKITANTNAAVSINGTHVGHTPTTVENLSKGKKKVSFRASGYKSLTKKITIEPGYNEIYGELKWKPPVKPVYLIEYRMSPPTSHFGFSIGYCKQWGGYLQYRTDLLQAEDKYLTESMLNDVDENFPGGEKKYFRSSITAGAMLRLFSFMYVYGGLGYGKYGAVYKAKIDKDSDAFYTPETYYNDGFYTAGLIKGVELECGITFKVLNFAASVGYSTIAGSNFGELHFGMGIDIKEFGL
ncbi:MAG: PEGA domain-containing protein [Prevotellaceae bacterium]|jgi:hypothetical protein|nr:PEGA domain-containing protein [Prevotellaceae bacterium]